MKQIFTYLLALLFFQISLSQESKLDSLEIELSKSKNNSQKVQLLNSYVQIAFENDIKKGLSFADSLLYYAKLENSFKEVSAAHRYKANYHMYKGEYPTALKYFKNSLEVNSSNNYTNGLYADNASMGNVYFYSRKYDSAKVKYNDALKIVLDYKIKNKYTSAYMSLANVNYNSKNNEKAIEYYIKAIDSSIYLKGNERKRVVPVYVNLGTLFLDRKEYKKSSLYLNQGYSLAKEINFKQGVADAGLKLGRSYYENNTNLEESEKILLNCIQIYKDLGDTPFLINAYLNLGDLYIITDELDNSIKIKTEAVSLSKSNNLSDYYYAATTSLAKSFYKNKNYQNSLKNVNTILKDTTDAKMTVLTKLSLFNLKSDLEAHNKNYSEAYTFSKILNKETEKQFETEKNRIVNDVQEKYETAKTEKKNQKLINKTIQQELVIEKDKNTKLLLAIVTALVLLGLLMFVFYASNKKKRLIWQSQLDIAKARQEEHQKIGEILHDNKAKDLEVISYELHSKGETQLSKDVLGIKEDIRKLSHELTQVPFSEMEFDKQIEALALKYFSDDFNVNLLKLKTINWNEIDDIVKRNLIVVIREGMSNAFNHAKASNFDVIFNHENKQLFVELKDNGIGFNPNQPHSGLGLTNIKVRVKEINGEVHITSNENKGTNININIVLA